MSFAAVEPFVLVALTLLWSATIARLLATGRWRPQRPITVLAALVLSLWGSSCAVVAADGAACVEPVFWLWLANLGIAFVDHQVTLSLVRRGEIAPPGTFGLRRAPG